MSRPTPTTSTPQDEPAASGAHRLPVLAEVLLVYGCSVGLAWGVDQFAGFGPWQERVFGRTVIDSLIALVLTPAAAMLWRGRPGPTGVFDPGRLKRALLTGQKALIVFVPLVFVFPAVTAAGFEIRGWGGGSILAAAYLAGSLAVLWLLRSSRVEDEPGFARVDPLLAAVVLLAGLLLVWGARRLHPIAGDVVTALLFVGFAEEFFFRGYLQARLNQAFGKPFEALGFRFGWGLLLASFLFGLAHVFSPADPGHWAWGVWTFMAGLAFGAVREKGGSYLASALVHGVTVIPAVIFA